MELEELLNRVREIAEILVIGNMTKLERRKYYKSKLKPAQNRIKKENEK